MLAKLVTFERDLVDNSFVTTTQIDRSLDSTFLIAYVHIPKVKYIEYVESSYFRISFTDGFVEVVKENGERFLCDAVFANGKTYTSKDVDKQHDFKLPENIIEQED